MLVVLSGGGTAGHIYPALALAEELVARGVEVRFAGTPEGIESRLVHEAGIEFAPFKAAGYRRGHPATIARGMGLIARSTHAAASWFKRIEPDVVVAFGGYVCLPVGRAAIKLAVPLVVHEQNSVMGMANRFLAKRAARVCLTYEHAGKGVTPASKTVVTGNPVRAAVLAATRSEGRALLGLPPRARVLLAFGGSRGAQHINEALISLKTELLARPDVHVVHVCGTGQLDAVEQALALAPGERARWQVYGYQDDMAACLAAADVVVARAGATSLAEIAARCVPAVIVPFPYAAENHQMMNARALVDAGAALLVEDAALDSPVFSSALFSLIDDARARARMERAAHGLKGRDAARLLADEVMAAARSGRTHAVSQER